MTWPRCQDSAGRVDDEADLQAVTVSEITREVVLNMPKFNTTFHILIGIIV